MLLFSSPIIITVSYCRNNWRNEFIWIKAFHNSIHLDQAKRSRLLCISKINCNIISHGLCIGDDGQGNSSTIVNSWLKSIIEKNWLFAMVKGSPEELVLCTCEFDDCYYWVLFSFIWEVWRMHSWGTSDFIVCWAFR